MALNKAAQMRGIELAEAELEGYLMALGRQTPDDVWLALCNLFTTESSKAMPAPVVILERIRSAKRTEVARAAVLDDPSPHGAEHDFGLRCLRIIAKLHAGEIELRPAERQMDEAARELLPQEALRRYNISSYDARTDEALA